MTKLTKKERNKIYSLALKHYNATIIFGNYIFLKGICNYIKLALLDIYNDCEEYSPYMNGIKQHYPEIDQHKPNNNNNNSYWFDCNSEEGIAKRKAIFAQAIKETTEDNFIVKLINKLKGYVKR